MAFRQPKNLQDYLVHVKLRPLCVSNRANRGTVHSRSARCDVCNYVVPSSRFTSHTTKRSYTINYQLDCNSYNVVYLITCKVCRLQYVGSTSTKFTCTLRFNNHKSRLGAYSGESTVNGACDGFTCKHFHGPEHHGLQDVGVRIIDEGSQWRWAGCGGGRVGIQITNFETRRPQRWRFPLQPESCRWRVVVANHVSAGVSI